jgi:hypothetical protein
LIELLDLSLHRVYIWPHYGDATDDEIPAGQYRRQPRNALQDGGQGRRQPRKYKSQCVILYKMEVAIKCIQEETEAALHSLRTDLEENMKHQMEEVLSCSDQKKQGLRKELTEKI